MTKARFLALSLFAMALPLGAQAQEAGPQVAASITYEEVERPEGLPEEFAATDATQLSFLKLTAIDGNPIDAALWRPAEGDADTIVVSIHGSGGNYTYNPVGPLSMNLATAGTSVLAINTRQSGDKVNTDNFFDVTNDIDAAVQTARALGFENIVLHGQSLGNIQVQYYAATHWSPDIKGVVLTSMFGDLPWKSRHILMQNEENYADLVAAAEQYLHEGKAGEVLPMEMSWLGGDSSPVTAQHFLTYRDTEIGTAVGVYWIKRVPYPMLLVRDGGDAIINDFEPYMLLSAATSEGSLVPSIDYKLLPNENGTSSAGHGFSQNKEPLAETVSGWIDGLGL